MAHIGIDQPVVTMVNIFTVEPANQQKLVDILIEATDAVMSKVDGFVSANIHASLDGTRVVNYAQWKSEEHFTAMLQNPRSTPTSARYALSPRRNATSTKSSTRRTLMSDGSTDVLIVGGGPVGLSTALFLARKGIRPILVERRPRLSTIPRATGLHARTVEIFRTVGLESAVQQAGMKIVGPGAELDLVRAGRATPLVMLGAQSLADLHKSFVMEAHDVDYDKFTPSWPIWCGQDHYEPLLYDAAVEAGAEIRFQNELIGLTQDQDGVTATVNDNGTTRTIRARYVVAADGVKSPVRELLQIGNRSDGMSPATSSASSSAPRSTCPSRHPGSR